MLEARGTFGVFGKYSEDKTVDPGTVIAAVGRLTCAASPRRKVPTTRHLAHCSEVDYRTVHDNALMGSAYGAATVSQITP